MSEALRDVLRDRSDEVPAFAFDADTLMSRAESRRRRRRLVNAVGVAALVAVIGGVVALGPGEGGDPEPVAPPARFAEPKLLFALGQVVHYGDESFDTGLELNRGLARTDHGIVLVHGTEVWFSDGTEKEKIGRVIDAQVPRSVTADAEGTLVAWVGPDGDEHSEVVVYDSRLREVVARLDAGPLPIETFPEVIAIEDGAVYWKRVSGRTDDPLLRYDLSTGEQTEVELPADATVSDVAAGAVMYWLSEPSPGQLVIESAGSRSRIEAFAWLADLSPSASFVFVAAPSRAPGNNTGGAVFDTGTGNEVGLPLPKGSAAPQFMGWVDGNTLAFWDHDRRAALTCEAPTGSCVVAVREPGDAATVWFPHFPGYRPG
jgi:hypothetical protein